MQIEFPKEEIEDAGATAGKLVRWRAPIFWAGFLLVMLTFLVVRYGMQEARHIKSFFQIGSELKGLKKGEDVDRSQLNAFIHKHPEIAPLIDHFLIEDYFTSGEKENAKRLGETALKRISHVKPLYREFAATSLLIESGEYEKALDQATELRYKISDERNYVKLTFFNLLRIATLEKTLGKESRLTWKVLSGMLSEKNNSLDPALRNEILSHFQQAGIPFEQFIQSHLSEV